MKEGIICYDTKGKIMFNSNGDVIEDKAPRKHKTRKNLTLQIFEDMRKFVTGDSFWDTFLIRASKNTFPKNFKYIGRSLVYKATTKKSREEVLLAEKPLKELFDDMRSFLKIKGIFSKEDELVNQSNIDNKPVKVVEINSWKEAKNLKYEKYILDDYINYMIEKYNLTKIEELNLKSVLRVGINGEFFHDGNIEVSDNKIISFDDLLWDPSKREFKIDMSGDIKTRKNEKSKSKREKSTYTYHSGTYGENKELLLEEHKTAGLKSKWDKMLERLYNNKELLEKYCER